MAGHTTLPRMSLNITLGVQQTKAILQTYVQVLTTKIQQTNNKYFLISTQF